jgi:hypothetical protein
VGPGDELQITVMEYKNLVPSPVSVEVKSVSNVGEISVQE